MRTHWALVLIAALTIGLCQAEVEKATTQEDVSNFLVENQGNIAALFFFDSSLNEGNEGGFWNGVVTSVSHIFSGEDNQGNVEHKASEIEQKISEEADLLQIDVSNEDLRDLQDQYEVTTIPYVIIYEKGVVVLSEVLNPDTHDKVLDILQVQPAETHEVVEEVPEVPEESAFQEEKPVLIPEATPAFIEITEPVVTKPELVVEPGVVKVKTPQVVAPKLTVQAPKMTAQAPRVTVQAPRVTVQAPQVPQKPKFVTLAPGQTHQQVVERPALVPRTPQRRAIRNATSEDTPYVKHKCKDMAHPKEIPRGSPGYIAELEDFEIPEEWWEYGYSPITGSNAEHLAYTRNVQFFEAENITYEPTEYKSPFIYNHYPYTAAEIIAEEPFTREEFLTPSEYTKNEEMAPNRYAREEFIRTPAGLVREEIPLFEGDANRQIRGSIWGVNQYAFPEVIDQTRPSVIQARITQANTEAQTEKKVATKEPGTPRRIYPKGNQGLVNAEDKTAAPAVQTQKPAAQAQKPVVQTQKPAVQTQKPVAQVQKLAAPAAKVETKVTLAEPGNPKRIFPQANQAYSNFTQKAAPAPSAQVQKPVAKATVTAAPAAPANKPARIFPQAPAQKPAAPAPVQKPAAPTPVQKPAAPVQRPVAPVKAAVQPSQRAPAPLRPGVPIKAGTPVTQK